MSRDILFEAGSFNATEVKPHFVNDCCFGEDVAVWLRDELVARGHPTTDPGQEDWGWYIETTVGGNTYFVGIGTTGECDDHPGRAEWRLMVERHRSLWDKLRGRNRTANDEAVCGVLLDVLAMNPDVTRPRFESEADES